MFRKGLIACVFAGLLAALPAAAQVVVRVAPPAPVYERAIPAPGPGYVWTPGYHRWDGRAYLWVPGAWVVAPRPHAHWVSAHWAHRGGGWVFVEGHWR
ncbi:conserved exported hypothetical protein [Candidatus Sulfopaludibacter sp. SbA3]|nr:conserved exported hypothetical protein [Candidatus Sulfopaludibacter sp. SbA3]